MSQTTVNIDHDEFFPGMKVDSQFDLVESFIAETAINFGRAVGANPGEILKVNQPVKDKAVLLFDADFVTNNVITITVNGIATAGVPFNTDHDTTAADVLTAIQGLAPVTSASISDSPTNREFTIETSGVVIAVSETITGGASQATGTPTLSSNDIFRGIALHVHKDATQPLSTNIGYKVDDAVNVLRQGKAVVETSIAVVADDAAFVDITGAIGKFTNASSGNLATNGFFRSTVSSAGLAKLEINVP